MKVNWSKYLFFEYKRRRKTRFVGHNVFVSCRYQGKFSLIEGVCIESRKKSRSNLVSSISVKNVRDTVYFINFPIYLSGSLNYKIVGLSYGYNVNCSRLLDSRYK